MLKGKGEENDAEHTLAAARLCFQDVHVNLQALRQMDNEYA